MHLRHLGLPVLDKDRSLRFYESYFGFDSATRQLYPDGTVIVRDADGFDLALHEAERVAPSPVFLHFGFRAADPEAVTALLTRLRAEGVEITEYDDEPDMVSFKCLDPDGHRVEVYFEP